jgi:inner membrane protease subunit 1
MLVAGTGRLAVQGSLSAVVTVLACTWARGPCRVAVKGLSMAPTLLPGDHLLVAPARRLQRGDLVVVRDPSSDERWVVKRVAALGGQQVEVAGTVLRAGADEIVVLGDNAAQSTDSRDYGAIPVAGVHGRVWYRYSPVYRAGKV